MVDIQTLASQIQTCFGDKLQSMNIVREEITIEVSAQFIREMALALRDDAAFKFTMLVDLCGVDYADYGISEWVTERATGTGFERGVSKQRVAAWKKPRFAVVYHLLSIELNQRLRVRAFPAGEPPMIDSVTDIWASANWYEREAFDLFGIIFNGHPDLRRILTDYGFIGHPFRKDFPLIGNVEVRYDATLDRVIYEPVSIESRTLVPKVIRNIDKTSETPVIPPAQDTPNV